MYNNYVLLSLDVISDKLEENLPTHNKISLYQFITVKPVLKVTPKL